MCIRRGDRYTNQQLSMTVTQFSDHVRLVEVGPRDGLQNESSQTSAEFRSEFINRLSKTGIKSIEVGSFVSPKWVPQMANTAEVLSLVERRENVSLIALVPNLIGLENAIASDVDEIAIFTAASETFTQKNTNCSIEQSFARFQPVVERAIDLDIPVRGYISCVLGCPYEGEISPSQVIPVMERLFNIGCYEVSLGDTIGIGTINKTHALLGAATDSVDLRTVAVHFHDTYGQALPNIAVALDYGIRVVDSSIGGLGGCPYARGASGNVATEDVVFMLNGMGMTTGVELDQILDTSNFVFKHLHKLPSSRVANAVIQSQQD